MHGRYLACSGTRGPGSSGCDCRVGESVAWDGHLSLPAVATRAGEQRSHAEMGAASGPSGFLWESWHSSPLTWERGMLAPQNTLPSHTHHPVARGRDAWPRGLSCWV